MAEAPLAITVNRTNAERDQHDHERQHHQRGRDPVASAASRPALAGRPLRWFGDGGHQAPRLRRAERSTTPRATRLMTIVITNRSTPSPISAARNTPEASPNWFAMTAGMA